MFGGSVWYTVGMKPLDADVCHHALLAHDTRFDGVFFTGVSSTGIYCRPVCTAKTPKRENCTFYPSAASAERAGYRPCLRCRPELAPGNAPVDANSRLAARAAIRIEAGALCDGSTAELAAELGVTARHLRRVFHSEFGVAPIELAQTQRLLLAKRLLTDTNLPITEIAFASGFASLRRFNALFQERYRLNPTALRKVRTMTPDSDTLTCDLAFRPPYDWQALVRFLIGHASASIEGMEGERYVRTVAIEEHKGWIAAMPLPNRHALRVEVSAGLTPVLLPLLNRIKFLFDLDAAPDLILAQLGDIAKPHPGLRVPGTLNGFEMAVRAVLGQQISVQAATTLSGRFAAAFGEAIATPFASLTRLTPTPERVAAVEIEEIIALGIIRARANTILGLARAVHSGAIILEPGSNVEQTIVNLKALPGIGEWTAQYIAMRALAHPDAFPHTDLGIYKALNEHNPKRVLELAERWRPWRAYAAMHLWKSLETKPKQENAPS